MNLTFIALATFTGGIASALLGWLDSKEVFNVRKFSASGIRSLVAGVVFAVGYSYSNGLAPIDLAIAFLGGSGIDVIANRAQGAIKRKK